MLDMQIISINIGKAASIAAKSGRTGIYKTPRSGPVPVSELGLQGDEICDRDNHGGPDQAVYIYGQPDYEWWQNQLDRSLEPGTFGENLTISGLESQRVRVGDRLKIGDVMLEVTWPRIPCVTFAARMDDKHWVKKFHAARRPGVYARVLKAGQIMRGAGVKFIAVEGSTKLAVDLM